MSRRAKVLGGGRRGAQDPTGTAAGAGDAAAAARRRPGRHLRLCLHRRRQGAPIASSPPRFHHETGRGHLLLFFFFFQDNYVAYYEMALQLLRRGGLVAVDNVLWSGRVVDESNRGRATEAIRRFNRHLAADQRVDISVLAVADGLSLALKK